jgi:transcriptional antiterminator
LIIIKEDEVAFIAMYIKAVVQNKFVKNHVGVVAIDMLIVSDLNAVSKATIILRGFDYNQIRNGY